MVAARNCRGHWMTKCTTCTCERVLGVRERGSLAGLAPQSTPSTHGVLWPACLSPTPSLSERPCTSVGTYGEKTWHLGLEQLVHSIWGAQSSRDISVNTVSKRESLREITQTLAQPQMFTGLSPAPSPPTPLYWWWRFAESQPRGCRSASGASQETMTAMAVMQ